MRPIRNLGMLALEPLCWARTCVLIVACGWVFLLPARCSARQTAAPAGVIIQEGTPQGAALNQPDPNAMLFHPVDQMRADPHWRVYAAVITHDHKTLQALLDAGDSPNGSGRSTGLPLIMACQIADLESVSVLVKSGANVNQFWHGASSPLLTAAGWQHPDIVRYLLAHGALPSEAAQPSGQSALFAALGRRDFGILTLLIEGGADVNLPDSGGDTPLMYAAASNDGELVRFLQDHGAKFKSHDEELLYYAASGDVAGIQRAIAAGARVNRPFERNVTPLMTAAQNGQTAAVRALIAHGANMNAYDEVHDTPLMFALKSTHKDTVLALLDAGADPTLANVAHVTTLHQAAIYIDDPEIVHRLIARGVPPAAGNSIGVTPLMNSASFGHLRTLKILLDEHVPVNVETTEGRTALIDAATSGHADILALLLQAGADPSIRDKQNHTALDYARQMHQQPAIALLEQSSPESSIAPSTPAK